MSSATEQTSHGPENAAGAHKMQIKPGSSSWFVCRAKGLVGDILLPIRATEASEEELVRVGRMKAARRFKKEHDLHPCTKVEVEFQGVEPASAKAEGR